MPGSQLLDAGSGIMDIDYDKGERSLGRKEPRRVGLREKDHASQEGLHELILSLHRHTLERHGKLEARLERMEKEIARARPDQDEHVRIATPKTSLAVLGASVSVCAAFLLIGSYPFNVMAASAFIYPGYMHGKTVYRWLGGL